MTDLPRIRADVTFLHPEEGGRSHIPGPPFTSRYRPHVVVQPPDIRRATFEGNRITDDYLGVLFLEGPSEYSAGQSARFLLECMYSGVNYATLCVGATFTIREGANVVGFGTVLSREERPRETIGSISTTEEDV